MLAPRTHAHPRLLCLQVPYLRSEYGKEYDFDAPVKLLDRMMHGHSDTAGQQVVVLSQVLAADVNIGYEEILNTQVRSQSGGWQLTFRACLLRSAITNLDGFRPQWSVRRS